MRLTLREAVQLAVAANPEVQAERVSTQRADALLRAARGVFDTFIQLGGDLRRETRPSSSVLEAPAGRVDEHFASGSAGFVQRLPWRGLALDGAVENTRQSSSNPFLALNPFYTPRARFTLSVPLLRGATTDAERTELRVRQREAMASRADLEVRLSEIVTRVANAYWQLVTARQSVVVAEQTRQAAADSLASTERLVREGEQAAAELSGARGQLARAEEALANEQGAARQAQHALQSLLAASAADTILDSSLEPVDHEAEPDAAPLVDLISIAMRGRAELRAFAERVRAQGDRVRQTANERLPRVDLQFNYVSQGLSGRERPSSDTGLPDLGFAFGPLPPVFLGGPWSAVSQIRDNRFPTYAASLRIELPLRNRGAEGRHAEAALAERQVRLQQEQLRIQVGLDVRQAVAARNAARERIAVAEQAERASAERLASELRLYREGQSTNLNLNVRQDELATSRQLLVRARQGFNIAATELLRATGQALTRYGVRTEGTRP